MFDYCAARSAYKIAADALLDGAGAAARVAVASYALLKRAGTAARSAYKIAADALLKRAGAAARVAVASYALLKRAGTAARVAVAAVAVVALLSCTPNPRIVGDDVNTGDDGRTVRRQTQEEVPAKRRRGYHQQDTIPVARRTIRTSDVDFARAFEEDPSPRPRGFAIEQTSRAESRRYPPFSVPMRPIRVMLSRNVRDAAFTASANATAQVRPAAGRPAAFSGRVTFETTGNATAATLINGRERVRVSLPCTLFVPAGSGTLALGDKVYRGSLVVVGEGSMISVINIVDVEEYIRGVVPLEIGNLREAEIEAVKAQAVAARTYAYKRMIANANRTFDVVATVADQVYGGQNAEGEMANRAVLQTKDLIMTYDDGIVHAFYHSTCGGRTAAIEDVWGGEALPYLRSIRDVDESGTAFCSSSRVFTWSDSWQINQLSEIIRQFSESGNLQPSAFSGSVRKIEVRERFDCGRVKTLAVTGNNNREFTAGGDKVRFLLRRNNQARSILRSSDIREINISGNNITISGGGYGHGIGMCQTGAIGRANAGQSFYEILGAYYTGMTIRTASE